MIIVLLLLFQSLCLYCQRLVLHIHDRCFPRNARLLQELAETVGDRKAVQHLEDLQLEQSKRRQKRRILEPILPLGAGDNLEACRFCAHSPQGYCRHHFHLQLHTRRQTGGGGGEQDYKQLRRIRRELKRSLEQQQQPARASCYSLKYSYRIGSTSSLSSGYASLSQEESRLLEENASCYPEEQEQAEVESCSSNQLEQEEASSGHVVQETAQEQHLITSHL